MSFAALLLTPPLPGSLAVLFVALFLPVVLSLFRFVPGVVESRLWTRIHATLNYPAAFGSRHREPVANLGQMPTRGQALYIFLISILNIVLCIVPVPYKQPNNSFPGDLEQALCVIGDRAGGLAMANMVAVFLFSTRNNVLISLTNWSHSTFLLLHRWIAYWVIIHSCFHSAMLLALYKIEGMYDSDSKSNWWTWGIVATIISVAIWPLSVLPLRARAYELFLAGHQILVALFLVGVFLHIYYLFTYDWGYEVRLSLCSSSVECLALTADLGLCGWGHLVRRPHLAPPPRRVQWCPYGSRHPH